MENASPELLRLFQAFPMLSVASKEQGPELSRFMEQSSMAADNFEITFTRGLDYFSLLEAQGQHSITLCIMGQEGQVLGVGSLTSRMSFVRGKPTPVGYFQDLRVSKHVTGSARQNFYEFFTEFVRLSPSLPDLNFCKFFYTAILSDNKAAKTALSRDRFILEYTKMYSYEAWLFPKIPGLGLLSSMNSYDFPSLQEVMDFYKAELGRSMYDLDLGDIERLWEYSIPLCLREKGNLLGVCLLADTNQLRKMKVCLKKINLTLSLSSTQIFGLRVQNRLSQKRKEDVKSALLRKAILKSFSLNTHYLGYIQVENDIEVGFHPLFLPKVVTKGDVYRVYHPDHVTLAGFGDGFLRPAHTGSFEWVLS
jgi:hypothetical protein